MELSEKPAIARPRVVHGPHRIRLSGTLAGVPAPKYTTAPTAVVGESEIVTEIEDVSVQVVPLDEQSTKQP